MNTFPDYFTTITTQFSPQNTLTPLTYTNHKFNYVIEPPENTLNPLENHLYNIEIADCTISKYNIEERKYLTHHDYILLWLSDDWNNNYEYVNLYDIKNQYEQILTIKQLHSKFPLPPPFSMWGTPLGHFWNYNILMCRTYEIYTTNIYKCIYKDQEHNY